MGKRPANAGKTYPAEVLTKTEVMALMDKCSKRSPSGCRDRAIICTLWRAQLRIGELLALRPSDFDPERCQIRVRDGKGRKARVAIIDQQACAVISEWIAVRKGRGINGHAPLFCTLKAGEMHPNAVRNKLKRLAKKAGLERRVHPHALRHTGASELVEEGVSLLDISDQLGHSSTATTDRYLHAVNPQARADRLRSRSW